MAVQVAEADFKRRARRRLMGAVALTILAVIILPLVLDKEPPPAGPLNIQMPPASGTSAPVDPAPAAPSAPAGNPAEGAGKMDSSAAAAGGQRAPSPGESTGQGEYSVQVGAFTDAANVDRIKAKIQSLGLPAFTDRLDGKTRVRAGPFPDKAAAEKAAGKLAAAGLPAKLESP
jgi:DedD protein